MFYLVPDLSKYIRMILVFSMLLIVLGFSHNIVPVKCHDSYLLLHEDISFGQRIGDAIKAIIKIALPDVTTAVGDFINAIRPKKEKNNQYTEEAVKATLKETLNKNAKSISAQLENLKLINNKLKLINAFLTTTIGANEKINYIISKIEGDVGSQDDIFWDNIYNVWAEAKAYMNGLELIKDEDMKEISETMLYDKLQKIKNAKQIAAITVENILAKKNKTICNYLEGPNGLRAKLNEINMAFKGIDILAGYTAADVSNSINKVILEFIGSEIKTMGLTSEEKSEYDAMLEAYEKMMKK